jgi:hypothetical protein
MNTRRTLMQKLYRPLTQISQCQDGITATLYNPHLKTSVFNTPRFVSQLNGVTRSVATNIIVSVYINYISSDNTS